MLQTGLCNTDDRPLRQDHRADERDRLRAHFREAARDPGPVFPDHQDERPLLPKAAMQLSGASPDLAGDCNWVGSGLEESSAPKC
jgi:hypothetical protein